MTINVGSMNATFSDSQINYTALGLRITEEGSSQSSNLLNFRINTQTKFSMDKFGQTRILTTLPTDSNTKILQIINDCKDLVIAIPNKVTIKTKTTRSQNVTYSKTYSEGHIVVYANSGVANVDVTKGSVFQLKSNTNTISQLILYTPSTLSSRGNVTYSFSLIVKGLNIANSVWNQSNVIWSNDKGYPPSVATSSNVSVYTLFGMRGFGQFVNNYVWYAFSSDKYLTIDTKQPPKELLLRYSVDSTEITVDTTLITVDSI